MSMIKPKAPDYSDGRTKQSFKDSTDINKILARAQKTGTISHLAQHGASYGDFADFDFTEAQNALARGKSIFEGLPSEVRAEFGQSPQAFYQYVNDPVNAGKLNELLPALAEPGRQLMSLKTGADEPSETLESSPADAGEDKTAAPVAEAPGTD